mmetsp:Transcript_23900/g.68037  ORF Transcript_23900/g.68037 Transcript_23900/m.68037 type:complete len:320 (+) Transcript_23900:1594-2553(+)
MQELLGEEGKPLSQKETHLLKLRFRRRFKPTDEVVLSKLHNTSLLQIPGQTFCTSRAGQRHTGDVNGSVVTGQDTRHTTRHDNRRLWTDNSHILKQLGVAVMQELLGEEPRSLSGNETKRLKDRFRGKFKPTDDVVLHELRKKDESAIQAVGRSTPIGDRTELGGETARGTLPRASSTKDMFCEHKKCSPQLSNRIEEQSYKEIPNLSGSGNGAPGSPANSVALTEQSTREPSMDATIASTPTAHQTGLRGAIPSSPFLSALMMKDMMGHVWVLLPPDLAQEADEVIFPLLSWSKKRTQPPDAINHQQTDASRLAVGPS